MKKNQIKYLQLGKNVYVITKRICIGSIWPTSQMELFWEQKQSCRSRQSLTIIGTTWRPRHQAGGPWGSLLHWRRNVCSSRAYDSSFIGTGARGGDLQGILLHQLQPLFAATGPEDSDAGFDGLAAHGGGAHTLLALALGEVEGWRVEAFRQTQNVEVKWTGGAVRQRGRSHLYDGAGAGLAHWGIGDHFVAAAWTEVGLCQDYVVDSRAKELRKVYLSTKTRVNIFEYFR